MIGQVNTELSIWQKGTIFAKAENISDLMNKCFDRLNALKCFQNLNFEDFIDNIVDFYCAKANLVIELDGSQHYEDKGIKYDAERTKFLEQNGLTVVRIPNNEINRNFDGVCEYLDSVLKSRCRTGD